MESKQQILVQTLLAFLLTANGCSNGPGNYGGITLSLGNPVPSSTMPSGSVVLFPFSVSVNNPNNPPQFESTTNEVTVTQIASDEIAVQAASNFTGAATIEGLPTSGGSSGGGNHGWNDGWNNSAFATINFVAPVGTVSLSASETSAALTDTVTLTPSVTGLTSPTYSFSLVAFTPGTTGSSSSELQTPSSDFPVLVTGGTSTATVTATGPGVSTIQVLAVGSNGTDQAVSQIQITFHD